MHDAGWSFLTLCNIDNSYWSFTSDSQRKNLHYEILNTIVKKITLYLISCFKFWAMKTIVANKFVFSLTLTTNWVMNPIQNALERILFNRWKLNKNCIRSRKHQLSSYFLCSKLFYSEISLYRTFFTSALWHWTKTEPSKLGSRVLLWMIIHREIGDNFRSLK